MTRSIELACEACKEAGKAAECVHMLHLVPSWQSAERHRKLKIMVSGVYIQLFCVRCSIYSSKFRHRKLESVRRTIPVEPPKPIRKPTIGMPEDISNHFNGERVYSDRRIYIDHLTDSVIGMSEDVHEHHM